MATTYSGFSAAPQLIAGPITATFTEVVAGSLGTLALDVPGARPGMFFIVKCPTLDANFAIVSAECTAVDVVDIRISYAVVGNATPTAASVYVIGL